MAAQHWTNCDFADTDLEIAQIDALEGLLDGPARDRALKLRTLITGLEVCHHNSLRWAQRIAQAIADGAIPAPSGRKRSEHPVSLAHLNLRELLASVVEGDTGIRRYGAIPQIDAAATARTCAALSDRHRWLVGLVLDNLEHHLHDADLIPAMRTADNRMAPGEELDVTDEDQARAYFADDFGHYTSWKSVTAHLVDDLHPGESEARMPLLLVVQFSNPCSANYFLYVRTLLGLVTGAEASPPFPFPFCGHCSAEQRAELGEYVRACRAFLSPGQAEGLGQESMFGDPDDGDLARRWLVASFGKTLRLQLGE